MKKVRGSLKQGTGRPQSEGATQSKVTLFLHVGRDKEALELKRKLDEMHHELNQSSKLRDTVKVILEDFR